MCCPGDGPRKETLGRARVQLPDHVQGCILLKNWHGKPVKHGVGNTRNMELEVIFIIQVGMGQSPTVPSHLSDEGKETSSPSFKVLVFQQFSLSNYFDLFCTIYLLHILSHDNFKHGDQAKTS